MRLSSLSALSGACLLHAGVLAFQFPGDFFAPLLPRFWPNPGDSVMFKLTTFKLSIFALLVLLAGLIFAAPWGLYYLGLQGISGKPALPVALLTDERQIELWQKAGCEGRPALDELNPVHYIMTAPSQEAPPPATMFAWRIASAYQREHKLHDGAMWQQLSGAALAIWITRNWSIEQILSKVQEQQDSKLH